MDILKKAYELVADAPKPVDENDYYREESNRYRLMLDQDLTEKDYQSFFEQNPSFMPGSREVIGAASSHWPIANALISQPSISDNEKIRRPDFMWIAKNSLCLCPVLIEIEKPSKKEFRLDSDVSRAQFNQALMQIKQWKPILNSTEGRQNFYKRFGIDEKRRQLKFTPQYVLVFGRRSEFEGDTWWTKIRAEEEEEEEEMADVRVMSFDRLDTPDRNAFDCITCKVKDGRFKVISIPPTFVYRPATISAIGGYAMFDDFVSCIRTMNYVTEERKQFLIDRFEYWNSHAGTIDTGLLDAFDRE